MDCREFRNNHVAFVDDLLPAFDMNAMQRHLGGCARCSRHDTAVRRSLMLVRSLPSVDVSPEFMSRLNARIERMGPESRTDWVAPRPVFTLPSIGAMTAFAAGMAAVAYMAVETNQYFTSPSPMEMAAVVAPRSVEQAPTSIADGAFVAAVPTGMPVWPAVLMMGQAPMHFANMELGQSSSER